ncbi:hypothetical protein C8R44DRAFT_846401 [Mycena epipterygia]|nr:hypothetical protein C8R44DRAFT_846401 [Mycena epipterygia]
MSMGAEVGEMSVERKDEDVLPIGVTHRSKIGSTPTHSHGLWEGRPTVPGMLEALGLRLGVDQPGRDNLDQPSANVRRHRANWPRSTRSSRLRQPRNTSADIDQLGRGAIKISPKGILRADGKPNTEKVEWKTLPQGAATAVTAAFDTRLNVFGGKSNGSGSGRFGSSEILVFHSLLLKSDQSWRPALNNTKPFNIPEVYVQSSGSECATGTIHGRLSIPAWNFLVPIPPDHSSPVALHHKPSCIARRLLIQTAACSPMSSGKRRNPPSPSSPSNIAPHCPSWTLHVSASKRAESFDLKLITSTPTNAWGLTNCYQLMVYARVLVQLSQYKRW